MKGHPLNRRIEDTIPSPKKKTAAESQESLEFKARKARNFTVDFRGIPGFLGKG